MKKQFIYLIAVLAIVVVSCQKELSFEQTITPSDGSLKSDNNNDCLPKTVNGTYEVGKALVGTANNITVDVNVNKTGSYEIATDTINGIYFRGTGVFTSAGANTVTLSGNGTPFAQGTFNFMVSYDSTFCDIQVDVLPAGAGGPAAFALVSGGTPVNCASAVPGGIFVKDAALNASNYVDVTVNVTTIGTYTITAAGGGITFSKSGAFLTTGNQVVRLAASGTPSTSGANTVTFSSPAGGCTFPVDVVGPAVYTVDCTSSFSSGTYQAGTALGAANTITVSLNVTTIGAVSITTATTNGMVFSGSANYTTTGVQTLVLTGTGTPATGGTTSIPVNGSCNVSITVAAAPTIDWTFKAGTTTYQGSTFGANYDVTLLPPFSLLFYEGDNISGDALTIDLTDITGGINNGEVYKANASVLPPGNMLEFNFENAAGTTTYTADISNGTNLSVTIVSHNTVTKTLTGTFSGTVKDGGGAVVNITNGSFTAVYP